MANPMIVPKVMTLYAPFCPEGRTFQRGEEWPGDAWSANPEGKEAEAGEQLTQAQNDLIEAHDEIERLEKMIASKDHDLAQLGKERDEAVAAAKAMKQDLLDAQKAKKTAEDVSRGLTQERDQARADAEAMKRKLSKAEAA